MAAAYARLTLYRRSFTILQRFIAPGGFVIDPPSFNWPPQEVLEGQTDFLNWLPAEWHDWAEQWLSAHNCPMDISYLVNDDRESPVLFRRMEILPKIEIAVPWRSDPTWLDTGDRLIKEFAWPTTTLAAYLFYNQIRSCSLLRGWAHTIDTVEVAEGAGMRLTVYKPHGTLEELMHNLDAAEVRTIVNEALTNLTSFRALHNRLTTRNIWYWRTNTGGYTYCLSSLERLQRFDMTMLGASHNVPIEPSMYLPGKDAVAIYTELGFATKGLARQRKSRHPARSQRMAMRKLLG